MPPAPGNHATLVSPGGRPPAVALHATLVGIQLAFSSLAIAGKLAFRFIPPDGVVFARVGAGAVAFVVVHAARRASLRVPVRELPHIALLALLGVVCNQVLFLRGLARTTAINATVIGATIPVFTVVVGLLLRRERWRWPLALGIPLSAGGVLYLVGAEALHLGRATVVGDLMIVVNALSYATYLVLARDLIARLGPARLIAWAFLLASLMTAPFAAAPLARAVPALPVAGWLALAWIVAIPTLFAYLASAWALRWAPSSMVAIYIYLQPVATALMAMAVLGERLNPRVAVAAVMILAGIALVTRRRP